MDTVEGKERNLCISEEILTYGSRLREIGKELSMTFQEIERVMKLVGEGEVYIGAAREDIYFYYARLSEMVLKLSEYYELGDKSAREIYVSMMNLDAYLASLFERIKKD